MKRSKFIREIVSAGCILRKRGSLHDIYLNPKNNKRTSVLKNKELDGSICGDIKKQLGIPA